MHIVPTNPLPLHPETELFDAGLIDENIDAFLCAVPPVDILIDECDGLDMKVLLRECARALGGAPFGNCRT
jgi:hypothetical protein